LCKTLSYEAPPRGIEDLRYPHLKADPKIAERLIQALRRAVLGEDTAAALMSFIEVTLGDDVLRRKFQNDKPQPLSRLLDEAVLMVNSRASASEGGKYAEVQLEQEEVGPDGELGLCWIIPEDYLNARILRGLLAEIILNAASHGKRAADHKVNLRCRVSPSDRQTGACCEFTNQMTTPVCGEVIMTEGSLVRMQRVLAHLQGLDLKLPSGANDSLFTTRLWLGPMRVEAEGGAVATKTVEWARFQERSS
jgi:hypothetical protein